MAFYGIYGPLFAVAALMTLGLALGVGKGIEASDLLLGIPAMFSLGLIMFMFALVIGILPAAVTGLIYWWLSGLPSITTLPSLARAAGMSVVGGFICMFFALMFGATFSDVFSDDALKVFVVPGMVAALICTVLVDRQNRRRSPNNSPERSHET